MFVARLKIDAHAQWGRRLEQIVLSGSSYWNIPGLSQD